MKKVLKIIFLLLVVSMCISLTMKLLSSEDNSKKRNYDEITEMILSKEKIIF